MELFSDLFRKFVHDVMSSDKQVLASIALKGNEFVSAINRRPDIRLIEVTTSNRDLLPDEIIAVV